MLNRGGEQIYVADLTVPPCFYASKEKDTALKTLSDSASAKVTMQSALPMNNPPWVDMLNWSLSLSSLVMNSRKQKNMHRR